MTQGTTGTEDSDDRRRISQQRGDQRHC